MVQVVSNPLPVTGLLMRPRRIRFFFLGRATWQRPPAKKTVSHAKKNGWPREKNPGNYAGTLAQGDLPRERAFIAFLICGIEKP